MSPDSRTVLDRPAPPPDFTVAYGEHPDHVADVRLPPALDGGTLVLLLHGGFWRDAYDRAHLGPLASALAAAGLVVATPEYRRTGAPGGGWPGTFDDVEAAVRLVPQLVAARTGVDRRIVLAGHSAGGQLALWTAARRRVTGVVALAPVADLRAGYALNLGGGAVADVLGGGPDEVPQRYDRVDPASVVPLGCPVRVVHGSRDAQVPLALSERFAAAARAAGDDVQLDVPDADHFELIDPIAPVWAAVRRAFAEVAALPPRVDGAGDSG